MLQRYDLLFVKSNTFVGRIIQKVTKSPYSHIAIVLDEWHVVETDWRYPLQVRHKTYKSKEYDVFRFVSSLSLVQKEIMDEFIKLYFNTPYDFLQTVTNGLFLLFGWQIYDAPERMNCSEMVDRMFKAAGIDLLGKEDGKVTPADLAQSDKLAQIVFL